MALLRSVLRKTDGEHRVKRSWNRNFEYVFDVGIPKINPNYIGTYDTNLHEEMHFLDMLITVKDNKDKLPSKMFSQSYKPLVEAFDKATPVIGDKAKKLFEDFAKECDIIYKKQRLQLLKSIPIYTYIQKVSRLSLKKNLELFLYSED